MFRTLITYIPFAITFSLKQLLPEIFQLDIIL